MKKHTEKKTKQKFKEGGEILINSNKGITLIALVITVIVLLILAGISISMLAGDNSILKKATTAKTNTNNAQIKEKIKLAYNSALTKDIADQKGEVDKSTFEDELKTEFPGKAIDIGESANKKEWVVTIDGVTENVPIGKDTPTVLKVAEHKNETFTTNTELEDIFGNKITVPAGFKITIDSPNYVTGGIVIEDVTYNNTIGSQFVWIPVGEIYTNMNKTESKTINLDRYTFLNDDWTIAEPPVPLSQEFTNTSGHQYWEKSNHIEETISRVGSIESNTNTTAKNLNDFLTKARKGYYIGRYEARTTVERNKAGEVATSVTEKSTDPIFNYITQLQASERSRNMYISESFDSDLMNSYAWDTALLFLQEFDDRDEISKNTKYSVQTSIQTGSVSSVGTTTDKICNVYDIAGNCFEWTTETNKETGGPCVFRGGNFQDGGYCYSSYRGADNTTLSVDASSFRPIIYLK